MGLMWDLIQHSQISETRSQADSLELRLEVMEQQLRRTNETLVQLLKALEQRFGEDLNGDGRIAQ